MSDNDAAKTAAARQAPQAATNASARKPWVRPRIDTASLAATAVPVRIKGGTNGESVNSLS